MHYADTSHYADSSPGLVALNGYPAAIPAFHFNAKPFILPTILFTYGVVALNNNALRNLDHSTNKTITQNNPGFKNKMDDYSQYIPAFAVYGLNVAGIKGKNNFIDRTIMYGLITLVYGATVTGLKRITLVTRPDGSAGNSFPSGHTATAFAAAEFLHQEYKNRCVWYSVAGYSVATGTGILRLYNNKHFLSDVVCAAGIGMFSTKLVYLIYPPLKKKFEKHKPAINI